MLYVKDTTGTVESVSNRLIEAAREHKMEVVGMHDLSEKLGREGMRLDRDCRVFEICNANRTRRALEAEMSVSTILPIRISVYEVPEHRVRLAVLKPTALLDLWGNRDLESLAQEAEDSLICIIDAACRSS